MNGHRGSYFGSGGVSDWYGIGSKRPRLMDSNPYLTVTSSSSGSYHQPYGPYGWSYPHHHHHHQVPLPGGASSFPAVRLRGLPFNCSDVDIFKFFAGLDIVDVFLVSQEGRFSGEAFVVFAGPMQAELALTQDRQTMGRRYVEVFRCKKQDYYNAIAAEVSEGAYGSLDSSPVVRRKSSNQRSLDKDDLEYTEVLKMRGLPYSVRKSEIVKFFGEFEVKEERVHIVCRPDGKATGEAYVEFDSAEEARGAMSKDRMMIGSRYVELFPSTPDEAGMATSRSRQ